MVDIFNTRLFYVADDKLHAVRVKQKTRWLGLPITIPGTITTEEEDVHAALIKKTQTRVQRVISANKTQLDEADRAFRASRTSMAAQSAINHVVLGSEKLPSLIQKEGEKALGGFTRKTIEIIQNIGVDRFQEVIHRNVAQLLIFAREEASGNNELKNHALPVGTKFFFHRNTESAYIIEEAPRVRPIIWDGQTVRLSFPYCVFIIKYKGTAYNGSSFFFRNATITQGSDLLFLPPLPDVSNAGDICYPSDMTYPQGGPTEVANILQTNFWNSNFRSEHWGKRIGYPIGPKKWGEITKSRPTDILKQDWIQAPQTVSTWYLEDPVDQVYRLQQHVEALASRIGTNIGEMILQKLTVDDLTQERVRFRAILTAAIKDTKLAETTGAVMMEYLDRLMIDSKLPDSLAHLDRTVANGVVTDMGDL